MASSLAQQDPETAARALTPRQRERRERIQAATFALLARHGGDALSMRLIAETAGVAERTLFNIYGSRDRLLASSARERSEDTIASAHAEGGDGIGFFRMLPEKLAEKTFESRELTRAFGAILVEHAEMVGLPEVYDRFAGSALRTIRDTGQLAIDDISLVSRFVCMGMVGIIVLWAKGEITDDTLETQLRLSLCQILLPYAEPPLAETLRQEAREHTRTLSRARSRTP